MSTGNRLEGLFPVPADFIGGIDRPPLENSPNLTRRSRILTCFCRLSYPQILLRRSLCLKRPRLVAEFAARLCRHCRNLNKAAFRSLPQPPPPGVKLPNAQIACAAKLRPTRATHLLVRDQLPPDRPHRLIFAAACVESYAPRQSAQDGVRCALTQNHPATFHCGRVCPPQNVTSSGYCIQGAAPFGIFPPRDTAVPHSGRLLVVSRVEI